MAPAPEEKRSSKKARTEVPGWLIFSDRFRVSSGAMHMLGLLCVGIEKKLSPPHCFWGFNMRFVIVLFFYHQKVVVFFDLYNP